ncbi:MULTISPECIES: phytanoyl-CoA dioxygenase family protein [Pseudoalteromonas]|jgi:ectoine hydroxylase-related dioxygenase (phytanoyl-CoA dioxygenase family)|uniref:phytanoyl-CoA dioxygenase family protein n=1 Tax=Pseudoalteromonas TaxID=53246 RepID=UPI001572861B|nr:MULTISPECIES: phytanoyl-CoA dioxygenase family protein [Pseudoalteromonas]MBR8843093.1 phytanoyl-CoA dioxygenase family protein [Pseudoalteromonas sp. JC3]MCG7552601.1 phytanoyl-CoA dioxygenase family protein [Pseudoalteromonas sp. Of11M-6]NSY33846.1 phytanoyl-CoA dioxygenase [Pseudoalteromonas sp. JC28]QUI69003.1 phytanoyl-CoA dioxygenase [Pseudoalteromonas sp. M8]UDM64298.1 phytanoyl-CoA dioxygenase family protein [Pseudoalteromonas piscicida]
MGKSVHNFDECGYVLKPKFISSTELNKIKQVVLAFHRAWQNDNSDFYQNKAVNSAYLTAPKYLDEQQRLVLFKFIASASLFKLASTIFTREFGFMNTQLFFNPVNASQLNYWHRDPQYHLTIEEQKQALLLGPEVVHFRLALEDEPGIELIPGTHKRWDLPQELNVRLEQAGYRNHNNLPNSEVIALKAGDLLVFSANMIHRGVYGKNRLALDVLLCEKRPELMTFMRNDCLPNSMQLAEVDYPNLFS